MKRISTFILRLMGWKLNYDIPEGVDRCVLVSAPHTSNWDFVIGRLAMWSFGIDVKILIKKELFFFPMGIFLKAVGGIPVDRKGGKTNITGQIAKKFAEQDKLCVLFTPEGTRSYNPNWKKGFYYLAIKADVPIFLGYIDYKHKTGGIKKKFVPSGDVNKDLEEIKTFYKDYSGKFPDQGVR